MRVLVPFRADDKPNPVRRGYNALPDHAFATVDVEFGGAIKPVGYLYVNGVYALADSVPSLGAYSMWSADFSIAMTWRIYRGRGPVGLRITVAHSAYPDAILDATLCDQNGSLGAITEAAYISAIHQAFILFGTYGLELVDKHTGRPNSALRSVNQIPDTKEYAIDPEFIARISR